MSEEVSLACYVILGFDYFEFEFGGMISRLRGAAITYRSCGGRSRFRTIVGIFVFEFGG